MVKVEIKFALNNLFEYLNEFCCLRNEQYYVFFFFAVEYHIKYMILQIFWSHLSILKISLYSNDQPTHTPTAVIYWYAIYDLTPNYSYVSKCMAFNQSIHQLLPLHELTFKKIRWSYQFGNDFNFIHIQFWFQENIWNQFTLPLLIDYVCSHLDKDIF